MISPYFTQSIQTASKKLGVCCTLLKKICRKYGITRWPYRKIQSIERSIQQAKERLQFLEHVVVEEHTKSAYNEMLKVRSELFELERKKEALLRPDKALINPYNLEPNYMLSFDPKTNSIETIERNLSLRSYLSTEGAQHRRTTMADNSGNMRPVSPILDNSEPEYSLRSTGSSPTLDFVKCSRSEDYDTMRCPVEIASEVTAYSETDSPVRNPLMRRNASLQLHQESCELPDKNMQWGIDAGASGKIFEDMSFQQNGSYEYYKLPSYTTSQGFSHSSLMEDDQRPVDLFQQSSSSSRSARWNEMGGSCWNKTVDRANLGAYMKKFSDTFPDDMILSNVTSTDDMSTIDENMSYSGNYERNSRTKINQESSWEGVHLTESLLRIFRRVDELEQENQQLRKRLSHVLETFPLLNRDTRE